jgi:hypothetical protein
MTSQGGLSGPPSMSWTIVEAGQEFVGWGWREKVEHVRPGFALLGVCDSGI